MGHHIKPPNIIITASRNRPPLKPSVLSTTPPQLEGGGCKKDHRHRHLPPMPFRSSLFPRFLFRNCKPESIHNHLRSSWLFSTEWAFTNKVLGKTTTL